MGVFSDYTGPQEFREAVDAYSYALDWTLRVAREKSWPSDWSQYGQDWIHSVYAAGPEDALTFWLWLVSVWEPTSTGAPDGWLDLYNLWALAGQQSERALGYDASGNFLTVIGGTILATAEDVAAMAITIVGAVEEIPEALTDWKWPILAIAGAVIVLKLM